MRYVLALICPPLAIARAGRPASALLAAAVLAFALAVSPSVGGLGLIGLTMLWACHAAGDHYAAVEVEAFNLGLKRSRERRFSGR